MARQPPADIVKAAQVSARKFGIPASVQLAQWILESGWGKHSPGNNPFGMKVRVGKNDPFLSLTTSEVIKGKTVTIVDKFRKFATIDDAFLAHAELLSTAPVYAPAFKALPNRDKFIDLMGSKYATAPNYAQTVKGLIKSQGLDKYD